MLHQNPDPRRIVAPVFFVEPADPACDRKHELPAVNFRAGRVTVLGVDAHGATPSRQGCRSF